MKGKTGLTEKTSSSKIYKFFKQANKSKKQFCKIEFKNYKTSCQ